MSQATETLAKPGGHATVDDVTVRLLRMIYVSEVYSAGTFAYVLETYEGLTAGQRRRFDACRRLEVMIAARLFDHLTKDLGLPIKPPVRTRQAVENLAPPRHGTWFDYMTDLESGAIRGVQGARALKATYQDREPNLCATLLASRMALRDFARDELDDETGSSLDRILALLSPEDREAVIAGE